MHTFNIGRTPPVTFGPGRLRKLPSLVAQLGGGPVSIIGDTILKDLGVTERIAESLEGKGIPCHVSAIVSGEPKDTLVDTLCQQTRDAAAKVIVGLGGGAAMDAAKVVAAIALSERPAQDFFLAASPLPESRLPAIAIPTTAGTGSEVTRTAVISAEDGRKSWFWGEGLMFSQAVLDPELTVSLPPHLTAWTGVDAVAHALEGSTARTTSPAGVLYGREALRLLTDALPKAVADGGDLDTRGKVLWASMLAGLALHNCNTHMGHNISHGLGSLAPVHHGLATGLALEVSLPWLVDQPEGAANYAGAAAALGGDARADALPDALSALMRACQIPATLPAACADVTPEALAAEMKAPANHGMSQNAACPIRDEDIDTLAAMMMRLPIAAAAA